jgi:hypothetical protein
MAKLDRFGEISSIFSSLSRPEKDTLVAYVDAFKGKSHREYEQTADFFRLLEDNPDISRSEILRKLKLNRKPKLFVNGFLLGVREALLDSMLLTRNVERPGEYSNRFRNRVFNRKKLMQATILMARANREQAEKLLNEVEKRAEKYEIPEQVLEAKQLLKLTFAQYRSVRTIERYGAEIATWTKILQDWQSAENVYSDFLFRIERLPASDKSFKSSINELEKLEKSTGMKSVAFLKTAAMARLKIAEEDFKGAMQYYNDMLEMRLNHPPLQSDKGVSDIRLKIGECEAALFDFDAAKKSFEEADKLVKNDTFESYLLRKYLMLIEFYQTPTAEIEEEIQKRIGSTYTSRVPYAMAVYYLLRALWLIYDKRPGKAADLLMNELSAIKNAPPKDQFYRNLYLFIAGADQAVGEGKMSNKYCDAALKNLKALNRQDLSARERLIIRALQSLKSAKLDFKVYRQRYADQLSKLEDTKGDTRWRALSHEVMPVHSWINHHTDKRRKLFKA